MKKSIIICNTGSNTLSKIDVENLGIETLNLSLEGKEIGPHGLSLYDKKIVVANNYSNTISLIDADKFKEEENIYIGAHPNDLAIYNNKLYVLCGEANSLIIYDLFKRDIDLELPMGVFPHSIVFFHEKNRAFISNMGDDTISIIDCIENKEIKRIKCNKYPTKIVISNNRKHLYICESYIGYATSGSISIISLEDLSLKATIKVGNGPVDFWEEEGYIYVSNFVEGSISVINVNKLKEESKIFISGMPRGIIKVNEKIFVGDYLNGKLKIIDLKGRMIKNIAIGKEPNAMLLVKNLH
ncbi:YncE family protein [Clostridium sp. CMCC3677]|uniref:YncE family protein n=1 Tax=Clostridium sp. CMCC3677 TaxID=2949963 RepID=UPI0013F02415|nr:YncE family protein [Clostridium sp. CMCC3677]NFG62284.1 YncE family protein [Clostridium botulinum]NFQ09679.1 YncE family protein [Clostridium botulinum]